MTTAVAILTVSHVLISLAGIATGFVMIGKLLRNSRSSGWTAAFLSTTVITSLSGFLFPVAHLTPAHVFGVISLAVLGVAVYAYYQRNLTGNWRVAYVVTAIFAQYLNFFVLIVQSFLKIPALRTLAPTQTEPAFAAAQGIAFVVFVAVGVLALIRFRGQPATAVKQQSLAAI